MMKMGGVCKHIQAVKELNKESVEKSNEDILDYLKDKEEVDIIEVIEKFSEKEVDALLESGQAIEYKGKIKLVE